MWYFTVHRISTTPVNLTVTAAASSLLPTIVGSPTKVISALQFPSPGDDHDSPGSPLVPPFGSLRTRANTCPDNIIAVGYSPDGGSSNKRLLPVTEPELYHKASGNSRLSDQLLKVAFEATAPSTGMGFL